MEGKFHDILKTKIHKFVSYSYDVSSKFPQEEKYGLKSQLCRASMSIMLNYIEGYARRRDKVKLNFYEISHGSSQECKYIIFFSKSEYEQGLDMMDEIGKMLWSTISQLEKKIHTT